MDVMIKVGPSGHCSLQQPGAPLGEQPSGAS